MQDPKQFTDMSDHPQNGFGNIDQDYFLSGNKIVADKKRFPEEEDPTEDCWFDDEYEMGGEA